MNKAKNQNLDGEIVTLEQAAKRVNLGISTVRIKAAECGAALKIGRSYRINIQKLIDYLNSMTSDKMRELKTEKQAELEKPLLCGKNTITSIRIDERLLDKIKLYAGFTGMTQTQMLNILICRGFEAFLEKETP